MGVTVGARWDDNSQNPRFRKAAEAGLIAYAEVNYPVALAAEWDRLGLPVIAHTSSNPTCSAAGIDRAVARRVKEGADRAGSPWIGEHLTWLGAAGSGSLGYQINPAFSRAFNDVAVDNLARLGAFYGRPLALELGPVYMPAATDYESEMHFLGDAARRTNSWIILDITHWQIANRNLGRAEEYGLDAIDPDRVVELHVAGMRMGSEGTFWHDAHQLVPPDDVLALLARLVPRFPALRAVTLEHHAAAPEDEFYTALERVRAAALA